MADDTVGGGMWPNSASRAAMRCHAPAREFQHRIEDWCVSVRGELFSGEVDRRETLLLVCSSVIMEVARKSF